MLRTTVFWMHLATGVAAGLVVLMMAVTGVILTYERQLLAAAAAEHRVEVPADAGRLPIDALVAGVRRDGFAPTDVVIHSDPAAPVEFRAGRSGSRLVDPFTGARVTPANETLDAFFSAVTRWHRWFDVDEDDRGIARAVTGACNLAFLFLLASGAYLWLPRAFAWATVRARVWFKGGGTSAQRDFNWHHVIGLWCLIPLIVIVATATVFGYDWANRLVYTVVGETPPVRGAPAATATPGPGAGDGLALEALLARAVVEFQRELGSWNTVTLTLPAGSSQAVQLRFDQGNGGQPQHRHDLSFDVRSGELVGWTRFDDQSAGARLRFWIRFLHTGEALGLAGQTVAGLASLGAVFMVWTGLSLSWRRLRRFRMRQRARTGTTSRILEGNSQ